jgi:hypothetical protein
VTTLSEPNLTALSGETADFLAGGEYPIPISQGLGTTSIEYKKFGVSLAYTPTVLANGRISIRVRPEVSELSSQGAITLNGFQVPALTVRRAETTVELGSGQSFMIAGLMSNNARRTRSKKMPGAGDLPILGSLFRSTSFRKGETELVIVVTPYLVKPVNANDIKLPTDGYQAPTNAAPASATWKATASLALRRPSPAPRPTGCAAAQGWRSDVPARSRRPSAAGDRKAQARQAPRGRTADAGCRSRLQSELREVNPCVIPIKKSRALASALSALAGLALPAAAVWPPTAALESIHQPVVESHQLYARRRTPVPAACRSPNSAAWRAGSRRWTALRRSDLASTIRSKRRNPRCGRWQLAGRYGMLVGDDRAGHPGLCQSGTVRIVVTRSKAEVPGCPTGRQKVGQPTCKNATSSNYGCATNGNLAAMVADPRAPDPGRYDQGDSDTVVMSSNQGDRHLSRREADRRTGLKNQSTQTGSKP